MKVTLARALRTTAARLRTSSPYQWGHFGACNCGHLAQTLTRRAPEEIHRAALERSSTWALPPVDDWGDAAYEYCPASGLPIDGIIDEMLAAGLRLEEIRHLETLTDKRILRRLPDGQRHLRRNSRADLILYLDTWAAIVEEEAGAAPVALAAE
jgi:hypothetical protein